MIQVTELRVGNWILYNKTNYEVCAEDFEWLQYDNNPIKPIPLTPEILEGCGFEKDTYNAPKISWHNDFVILDEDYGFLVENAWADARYIKIPYLHQLQNLYWWFCGEELKVNL